jgi:hypothetical protein
MSGGIVCVWLHVSAEPGSKAEPVNRCWIVPPAKD